MKQDQLVISFPRMGSYPILIERVLAMLFPEAKILPPPPFTEKTLEIGSRYSPENVCSPFKFNVGNFIEVLEQGANVLAQTGLGCIFGYYGEIQERILEDMGYSFRFLCFSRGRDSMLKAFRTYKELGGKRSFHTLAKATFYVISGMRAVDRFEYQMRENMAFEACPGSHEALHHKLLDDLRVVPLAKLPPLLWHYRRKLNNIPLDMPKNPLKVGLVGELFTLMEPYATFNLERELAEAGCSVSRKMSATFLFSPHNRASAASAKGYLTRQPGANGTDSVGQAAAYARQGYDGLIHLKSFGCTPELNAIPALNRVGRDYRIPVLHLSSDTHTVETGLQTRLEAFVDMLRMRKTGGIVC